MSASTTSLMKPSWRSQLRRITLMSVGLALVLGFSARVRAQEGGLPEDPYIAPAASGSANAREAEVDSLIAAQDYQAARSLLEASLVEFPEHEGLLASNFALTMLEHMQDDVEQFSSEKGTIQVPDAAEARSLEGRVDSLIWRGRFTEARILLDRALTQFPDHRGLQASQQLLGTVNFLWKATQTIVAAFLVLLFSSSAVIGALLWRRRPLKAAAVYVTVIYMLFVPLAVGLGLVAAALEAAEKEHAGALPHTLEHIFLIAVAAFLGAVGGAIHGSFVLSRYHPSQVPQLSIFEFFFFKPLNGFFLAAVMYLALLSGQLALFETDAGEPPSVWSVGLLASLTGIFAESAIEKLRQISDTLFGSQRDQVPPEDRSMERPAQATAAAMEVAQDHTDHLLDPPSRVVGEAATVA